jgi:hypothetical protein
MENAQLKKDTAGRPTLLTEERAAAIIQDISDRIPYRLAAEANGICEDTLYHWIKEGAKDRRAGRDTPLARFSESIKRTERKKIKEHLDVLSQRPERWQADAWILERRWWKDFSPAAALIEMNKRLDAMDSKNEEDETD